MDPAESLEDHHPGVLDEVVQAGHQEEIVYQNSFAVSQLLLGAVKVKVDIEVLNEAGDGGRCRTPPGSP